MCIVYYRCIECTSTKTTNTIQIYIYHLLTICGIMTNLVLSLVVQTFQTEVSLYLKHNILQNVKIKNKTLNKQVSWRAKLLFYLDCATLRLVT